MLSTALILLSLVDPHPHVPPAEPVQAMVKQVADSGRCTTVADSPDSRVAPGPMLPAGPPPLLSFRYYENKAHNAGGNSGLMLDDAGH